jgi:nicotinamide-nucleotide amidase
MIQSKGAAILTIGDEILYGQINDTNATFISAQLSDLGMPVIWRCSVGDTKEQIISALSIAFEEADVVITTGGLGPTKDDITKHTLAEYFGQPLEEDPSVLAHLQRLYEVRGKVLNDLNRTQALVPKDCVVLPNQNGTAPGMWLEKNNKVCVCLPGVPFEMKALLKNEVLPKLVSQFHVTPVQHVYVRTSGIGESNLAELIALWEDALPEGIKLAYLPSFGTVKLRLSARGASFQSALLAEQKKVVSLIGKYVYALADIDAEVHLASLLKERNQSIALAESCTGGWLSQLLTAMPGSSAWYKGSIVAYANEVKIDLLNVPQDVITTHGAVSKEVVEIMAQQVRLKLKTDYGIAVSGIAGPEGGTEEKPVGTVYIAVSSENYSTSKVLKLSMNREYNIRSAANAAIELCRRIIENKM